MLTEEETRSYILSHIPNGQWYIDHQEVPYFWGKTWAQVFADGGISAYRQDQVLKRLRQLYGAHQMWSV